MRISATIKKRNQSAHENHFKIDETASRTVKPCLDFDRVPQTCSSDCLNNEFSSYQALNNRSKIKDDGGN